MSQKRIKPGVVLDHNFPVMPIILIVFALILKIAARALGWWSPVFILDIITMVLIFAGFVLHRVKMQILTGVGSLIISVYYLYLSFSRMIYISRYGFEAGNIFYILLYLLAVAAFTVTGLHCVLRRPKPGKPAKLILMIPLSCLWLIDMIVQALQLASMNSGAVWFFAVLNGFSSILLAFALMIYTPFREG